MRLPERKNVKVIEDACQAIGAAQQGKRAGVLGDTGCFSFFPTKNLGGFGDGGLITTNDKALADSMAMLRVHGSQVRYLHEAVGINSRLDALQAAVLQVKLKYLDQWTERPTSECRTVSADVCSDEACGSRGASANGAWQFPRL